MIAKIKAKICGLCKCCCKKKSAEISITHEKTTKIDLDNSLGNIVLPSLQNRRSSINSNEDKSAFHESAENTTKHIMNEQTNYRFNNMTLEEIQKSQPGNEQSAHVVNSQVLIVEESPKKPQTLLKRTQSIRQKNMNTLERITTSIKGMQQNSK
jgi:hypothetical protein